MTPPLSRRRREAGFTLSELVVAMALGLSVLALLLGYFVRLLEAETSLSGRLALDRDLAELASVMRSEIRRAVVLEATGGRRFMRPKADCLLFHYRSVDGRIRVGGYRLRHGRVQRRTSAGCPAGACRGCGQGRWASLSEASAWRAMRLAFRLHGAGRDPVLVEVVVEARQARPPWAERRLDLRILARS